MYTAAICPYLFLGPYFCRTGILYLNYTRYSYNPTVIGPPVKCHLNGVSLACRWWPNIECWRGSFVNFRGSGQVLLRNLVFFRGGGGGGGGGPDPLSPLWIQLYTAAIWPYFFLGPYFCRMGILYLNYTRYSYKLTRPSSARQQNAI